MNVIEKSALQPIFVNENDVSRRDSQLSFVSINHGKLQERHSLEVSVTSEQTKEIKDCITEDMHTLHSIANFMSIGMVSTLIALAFVIDNFNQIEQRDEAGLTLADGHMTLNSILSGLALLMVIVSVP